MSEISKEELEHLYVVENKSMNEISKITDISVGKIYRLIHDYKIPVKPQYQGFKGSIIQMRLKRRLVIYILVNMSQMKLEEKCLNLK